MMIISLRALSYLRHASPLCVVVFMHLHERRKSPREMDRKAAKGGRSAQLRGFWATGKRARGHDTRLPDGDCRLASNADVNWSLCRSGILYETQGAGCSPRRSVHAGGHRCVAV